MQIMRFEDSFRNTLDYRDLYIKTLCINIKHITIELVTYYFNESFLQTEEGFVNTLLGSNLVEPVVEESYEKLDIPTQCVRSMHNIMKIDTNLNPLLNMSNGYEKVSKREKFKRVKMKFVPNTYVMIPYFNKAQMSVILLKGSIRFPFLSVFP